MKLTALHNYIRRATRHGKSEINKTEPSSLLIHVIKEFLFRLGKSIGILSVPIVFIDVVGYPACVTGSSMEVIFAFSSFFLLRLQYITGFNSV